MTADLVVKGQLHIGCATYIEGEFVRLRDYRSLERTSSMQAKEIERLSGLLGRVLTSGRLTGHALADEIRAVDVSVTTEEKTNG